MFPTSFESEIGVAELLKIGWWPYLTQYTACSAASTTSTIPQASGLYEYVSFREPDITETVRKPKPVNWDTTQPILRVGMWEVKVTGELASEG